MQIGMFPNQSFHLLFMNGATFVGISLLGYSSLIGGLMGYFKQTGAHFCELNSPFVG